MYRFSPKTLQFTNYFKTDKTPLEIECKEFVKNIKLAKKTFQMLKMLLMLLMSWKNLDF